MIYAGCDVGSLITKAVIFENGNIAGKSIIETKATPQESSEVVMSLALEDACIKMDDITYMVSTGYGKDRIPIADSGQSEIDCHARGAWWCSPSTRTVIDIGGKDTRAIRVDNIGNVINYRYSEKFAPGSGRKLEIVTKALAVVALTKSIGIEDDVLITGGVAKNSAVFGALKQNLNCNLVSLTGFDPQLTGALGAALLAQEISGNSHKAA